MKKLLKSKLVLTLVLLVMVGVALIGAMVAPNIGAHAAAPRPRADINGKARLLNDGTGYVDVPVAYRCSGGTGGTAMVTVTQTPQQSGTGTGATGSNTLPVNCDGQAHQVGVDVPPSTPFPGSHVGKATAMVTLTDPSGATATDTKTIKIVY
ncbi:MAG: hypothetical protein NVS4B11_25520 [Ktedonobacteraceae bacterium]